MTPDKTPICVKATKKIHFVAIWFEKTKYFNFKVEIDIYRFKNEMQKVFTKISKARSVLWRLSVFACIPIVYPIDRCLFIDSTI